MSLDERTADRLRRLLLEVWSAQPTTAILVTHNAREAILLADQLVLFAPRPTQVVAAVPIDLPQVKRDPDAVEGSMPICSSAIPPISPLAEAAQRAGHAVTGAASLTLLDTEGRVVSPEGQGQECHKAAVTTPSAIQLTWRYKAKRISSTA